MIQKYSGSGCHAMPNNLAFYLIKAHQMPHFADPPNQGTTAFQFPAIW